MRKVLAAVATVLALTFVSSASAVLGNTNKARLFQHSTSPTGVIGVRVTIGTPAGSQETLSNPDFFGTHVEADNGETFASNFTSLSQGIFDTSATAIDPNGDCHDSSHTNELYYYTERNIHGTFTCYWDGPAPTSEPHLAAVRRDSSNNWWGYLDGVKQSQMSVNWNDANCGHDECGIEVGSEEGGDANGNPKAGTWWAKFNGSYTPWQFETSCCWDTIQKNHYSIAYDPSLWTFTDNNFPNGLWTFIYSH